MLTDEDAEICVYIAADTTKARTLWSDCVRDYHRLLPASAMRRLRTVWIPADIDLDRSEDRDLIRNLLSDELASDVLLNVVLGNLSSESISLFASSSGSLGLDLAVLHTIAIDGFTNIPRLSERVGRSSSAVRERLTRLVGCGFLKLPSVAASYFHVTLRGRVFLELARDLHENRLEHPELQRLLRLLDLAEGPDRSASELGKATVHRIDDAVESYGVDLSRSDYHRFWESDAWPPMIARPAGLHDS
jgi:DNA-binding Lrp family transcriptional regulator